MGFLSELSAEIAKSTKGTRTTQKFRNPNDASQTWTGLVRKPNWVQDELKAGADIFDLETLSFEIVGMDTKCYHK